MSMLRWNASERYEPEFYIGSENEDGSHRADVDGWPYSIYRKAAQIGVSDVVICHGIQDFDDAVEICDRIGCFA